MKLAIPLLVGLLAAAPVYAAQHQRVIDEWWPDEDQTVILGDGRTGSSGTPAENVVSTGPTWMLNETLPNCPSEEDSASVRIVLGDKALLTVGPGASLVGPVQIFGADGRLQLSLPAGARIGRAFAVARFCTPLLANPSSEKSK